MTKDKDRNNKDNEYLLHLEDVYKLYPDQDGNMFTVLNDIDFKVKAGEFVTLIGPSGCGKSTLLRLILGSEQPTRGQVLFEGKPIEAPDRDRGIVFQRYSLFPHLTVMDNLLFGLKMEEFTLGRRMFDRSSLREKRREYREIAREYLERIGLSDSGDKFPAQLSGGMRQRVAIAQALIMKPRILLMDEPFGALDYSTRQDMQLFILEQWEQTGMTIFFVTHDLEEAVFVGSRNIVLTQYYSSDSDRQEGAKIVTDIEIPGPYPRTSEFKFSPEMGATIDKIRHDGLDPDFCQHIKDFDLRHKDAYHTVDPEEWKR